MAGFLSPISVQGADAAAFLHGQFTTDITGLAPGRACLSAWCDPKGRVIATFILARQDEAFLLLAPDDMKEAFVKRLNMFVLRSNVVIAGAGQEDAAQSPYLPGMDGVDPETSFTRRGIPLLHPETSGRFLPQELNLDRLDAVSFTKGCYPGQEIIARLRYRGAVKRRLCHAITDNTTRLQPGAALLPEGEDRHIGTIINSAITDEGQELLVVLERPFIETGGVVAEDFPTLPVKSIKETNGIGQPGPATSSRDLVMASLNPSNNPFSNID